jgi:hypothetical protein
VSWIYRSTASAAFVPSEIFKPSDIFKIVFTVPISVFRSFCAFRIIPNPNHLGLLFRLEIHWVTPYIMMMIVALTQKALGDIKTRFETDRVSLLRVSGGVAQAALVLRLLADGDTRDACLQ